MSFRVHAIDATCGLSRAPDSLICAQVWKELFILPLSSERPPDKPTPQLEVSCWDHDTVSGDDAMGTATLRLEKWTSQEKRTGEKVWLPLEGEGASGDVCVCA